MPKDSTGRRLTYQEQQNSGGGDSGKGRYYQENQTLGSLAGEQGKAYIQGVEEKKKALDDAQKELGQIVYAADMDEIHRMSQEEQDALASYKLARDLATMDGNNPVHGKTLYQEWNRVQEIFRGRYDGKRINELTETYGRYQNAEMMRKVREYGQAQGHGDTGTKIWSSALTIPANVLGKATSLPGHMLDMTYSTGRYGGFDPNSMGGALGVYADSVRGAVAEDIQGDGESFWRNRLAKLYLGGLGGADKALEILLYRDFAHIISGLDAFGDTLSDASAKGASYEEALGLGFGNAAITAGTEKLSQNLLLKTARGAPKGWEGMIQDAVKTGLVKGSAKSVDTLLKIALDSYILQNESSYCRAVALKMLSGISYEEASQNVNVNIMRYILSSLEIEGISGSVSSAIMSGYSHGKAANEGKKVRKQDQKELAEIQNLLGENAPKTLEEFQELKYNSGQWELFKIYQREIEKGKLTPLADFQLFQEIGSKTDALLVGATTSKGIQITDKAIHFSSRVIGSIEERRSGVNLEDVLEALINPNAEILPIKYDKYGQPGQKYRYGNVEVTINPETGNLVQTNPYRSNHPKNGD